MTSLWKQTTPGPWREALAAYPATLTLQSVAKLPERDRWYREDLPPAIAARHPPHVTLAELIGITEWKMSRGVWRARNLVLVKGNEADLVRETSAKALAKLAHPTAPIAALAELAGVGPATGSAVVAAAAPTRFPFFDDIVAVQVPELGEVTYTLGYYARYAEALRERASALGPDWTPVMVERALWAHAGGKAGARKH